MTVVEKSDQIESSGSIILKALEYGQKIRSEKTGYLHLFYHPKKELDHSHCIPLVENLYFAFALMQSKTSEMVLEGFSLTEKILSFQISEGEKSGHFPVYLHQYPDTSDLFWTLEVLTCLFYIARDCQSCMPKPLVEKLEKALLKALEACENVSNSIGYPWIMQLRYSCLKIAIGSRLSDSRLIDTGKQML